MDSTLTNANAMASILASIVKFRHYKTKLILRNQCAFVTIVRTTEFVTNLIQRFKNINVDVHPVSMGSDAKDLSQLLSLEKILMFR